MQSFSMRRILKAAQDAGCLCSVCFFFSSLLGVLLHQVRHCSSVTLTVNFEKRADRFYLLRRILELLSISRLPLSKCSCRNQSWRALDGYHTERTQNASDHLRVHFLSCNFEWQSASRCTSCVVLAHGSKARYASHAW